VLIVFCYTDVALMLSIDVQRSSPYRVGRQNPKLKPETHSNGEGDTPLSPVQRAHVKKTAEQPPTEQPKDGKTSHEKTHKRVHQSSQPPVDHTTSNSAPPSRAKPEWTVIPKKAAGSVTKGRVNRSTAWGRFLHVGRLGLRKVFGGWFQRFAVDRAKTEDNLKLSARGQKGMTPLASSWTVKLSAVFQRLFSWYDVAQGFLRLTKTPPDSSLPLLGQFKSSFKSMESAETESQAGVIQLNEKRERRRWWSRLLDPAKYVKRKLQGFGVGKTFWSVLQRFARGGRKAEERVKRFARDVTVEPEHKEAVVLMRPPLTGWKGVWERVRAWIRLFVLGPVTAWIRNWATRGGNLLGM
jgi:hypothetical protein